MHFRLQCNTFKCIKRILTNIENLHWYAKQLTVQISLASKLWVETRSFYWKLLVFYKSLSKVWIQTAFQVWNNYFNYNFEQDQIAVCSSGLSAQIIINLSQVNWKFCTLYFVWRGGKLIRLTSQQSSILWSSLIIISEDDFNHQQCSVQANLSSFDKFSKWWITDSKSVMAIRMAGKHSKANRSNEMLFNWLAKGFTNKKRIRW